MDFNTPHMVRDGNTDISLQEEIQQFKSNMFFVRFYLLKN